MVVKFNKIEFFIAPCCGVTCGHYLRGHCGKVKHELIFLQVMQGSAQQTAICTQSPNSHETTDHPPAENG